MYPALSAGAGIGFIEGGGGAHDAARASSNRATAPIAAREDVVVVGLLAIGLFAIGLFAIEVSPETRFTPILESKSVVWQVCCRSDK